MTVRELAAILAVQNQDADVVYEDYFNGVLVGETIRSAVLCERNDVNHGIRLHGDGPGYQGSSFLPVILLRSR
jgi:hypothetical protein